MSAAVERPSHFRPDIEGLRAIAVMAVLLFHMQVPGFSGGFIGVDVFNVISGFLITGLLVREVGLTGRVDLPTFYFRRARRLLPAALTVIVVTLIASAFILSPIRFPSVAADGAASAFYVSNIHFANQGTDYLASALDPSPYQQFWSLGVEEQFYLVWPLLVMLAARLVGVRRLVWVLGAVVVASFTASYVLTDISAPWAFFSLPTRAWELGAGGLVAIGIAGRVPRRVLPTLGVAGLALILAGVTLFDESIPYPGIAALVPTVGTMLLIIAASDAAGWLARGLGSRVPRSIGGVSYSLYLWHWPLLILVPIALSDDSFGLRLLLGAVAIGCAYVSTRVIEAPFRFGRIARTPALRGVATGLAVSLLVGTTALAAGTIAPDPLRDVEGPAVGAQATERPRPTRRPRPSPSALEPTPEATAEPTVEPTAPPTLEPTPEATAEPTAEPTAPPTLEPTPEATAEPTAEPTAPPTPEPPAEPTLDVTPGSTMTVTPSPAPQATALPSDEPTTAPTPEATDAPTPEPTVPPTLQPTPEPTVPPTPQPTPMPTLPPVADPVTAGALPKGLSPRLRDVKGDLPASYADGCHLDFDGQSTGECVYGYPDGASTVALFGDSHAAQWLPAIEELGYVRDWRVVSLTKSACPPVDLTIWSVNKKRIYRECAAWHEKAFERIASESPVIVFLGAYHLYQFMEDDQRVLLAEDPTAWAEGLTRTIETIQATGAQVILLGETPQLSVTPDECLADHRDKIESCRQSAADVIDAGYAQLERDVAAATGARLMSLTDVICPDGTCPLVFGTTPVYRDDQHLTATFVRGLAPTIDEWLDMEGG